MLPTDMHDVPGVLPLPEPMVGNNSKPSPPTQLIPKGQRAVSKTQTTAGPAEAVIVVPHTQNSKTDRNGKVRMDVYPISALINKLGPQDRSYRVHRVDTLDGIAKQYHVTPRCIRVANGITSSGALHAGSIIHVPGTYDVALDGQPVNMDVNPRIENGIPLTPFRQIMEHAGGIVVWYPESHQVRAQNENQDIKLQIGSKEATVNQMIVMMERPAFLDSGRTVVPMSFMEKALDLKAEYDVKSHTVMLVHK